MTDVDKLIETAKAIHEELVQRAEALSQAHTKARGSDRVGNESIHRLRLELAETLKAADDIAAAIRKLEPFEE